MNKVAVASLNKKLNLRVSREAEAKIKSAALEILKKLRKNGVFLEIFLADNKKMRFLNRKFRGKNKPADVLSFKEPKNFPHPEMRMRHIGEIYLNLQPSTFKIQDSRLLAHGILHLFGYSHKRKGDRMKMEKKELYISRN